MNPKKTYLEGINASFLILLAIHFPVVCGVALYFGTGVRLAVVMSLLFLGGPGLLYFSDGGSKLTSVALGIASMCFSALLIHLSGGMIEMHFHIFTMLALMIAFRFPWPLVAAATAIAVHHVAFFLWLPHSIFSYQASPGIVSLHAFFVIFEVVPALWLTHLLQQSAVSSDAAQSRLTLMADSIRGVVSEISASVVALSGTSAGLTTKSDVMTASSRSASSRTQVIASATEEMSSAATVVAFAMDKTAARLTEVVSATEKMSGTIGEIAGNSDKARRVSTEATQRAVEVSEQMSQLRHSVMEIGKISETITEISSQTNLLALNATIEAARAGSAGKGFSVVANEIKLLAQQTAAATEDIKSRVTSLQESAAGRMGEIEGISEVVTQLSGLVSKITESIEEQVNVTRDIARNITEASSGVKEANQQVSQTSRVSAEIVKDIAGMSKISSEMARSSEQLLVDSGEISRVADQLKSGMSRFEGFYSSYDRLVSEN